MDGLGTYRGDCLCSSAWKDEKNKTFLLGRGGECLGLRTGEMMECLLYPEYKSLDTP